MEIAMHSLEMERVDWTNFLIPQVMRHGRTMRNGGGRGHVQAALSRCRISVGPAALSSGMNMLWDGVIVGPQSIVFASQAAETLVGHRQNGFLGSQVTTSAGLMLSPCLRWIVHTNSS